MDLISRRDAITFVNNLYPRMPFMPMNRKWWQERYKDFIFIENYLRNLPSAQPEVLAHGEGELSAQPEIIRCGECMHKDKKIDYCNYLGITICESDYCSYAERRTDG